VTDSTRDTFIAGIDTRFAPLVLALHEKLHAATIPADKKL
jgi:hypothetical protein